MYEYLNVNIPIKDGLKTHKGDSFKMCMDAIHNYAKQGWRLVQIVIPPNEKSGIMAAYAYEIIFEKSTE